MTPLDAALRRPPRTRVVQRMRSAPALPEPPEPPPAPNDALPPGFWSITFRVPFTSYVVCLWLCRSA